MGSWLLVLPNPTTTEKTESNSSSKTIIQRQSRCLNEVKKKKLLETSAAPPMRLEKTRARILIV
jgi:hypothetical protein